MNQSIQWVYFKSGQRQCYTFEKNIYELDVDDENDDWIRGQWLINSVWMCPKRFMLQYSIETACNLFRNGSL